MIDTRNYEDLDKIYQKVLNKSVEHHDYYIFDYDPRQELFVRNHIQYLKAKINNSNRGFHMIEVEMPNGEREYRDKITKSPAVAVICIDESTNEIILVAQSRPVVSSITYELPAGHIDKGEYPRVAAARELLEETGIRVEAKYLHELPTVFTSPGFTDEMFFFYYIELNGIDQENQSLDNDEFINVVRFNYDDFLYYLTTTDDIVDGKTSIGVLCYDRHKRDLEDIRTVHGMLKD